MLNYDKTETFKCYGCDTYRDFKAPVLVEMIANGWCLLLVDRSLVPTCPECTTKVKAYAKLKDD